ncbi:MAG: circadian clock protein KaiC, partial [Pseudomonadota bacterium]
MIEKFETGISGFDELSFGGLPVGRTTLIAGDAGCGKTLFALEALIRGAAAKGEPVLFITFEETPRNLIDNARSIGLDLEPLIASGALRIDHVSAASVADDEVGSYSLEGLRLRVELGLRASGATFLGIDTIEALFARFRDERAVRAELAALLTFLAGRGVTTLMTGERGGAAITRRRLEEYVSDCVLLLEQDVVDDVSTRRMQIVKYRGARHGSNKYPFLIDAGGFWVMPMSSARLDHDVSFERASTGLDTLDEALGGGIRKGSTTLVSGGAGSGKTIVAATMIEAACARGETSVYASFEESPKELARNASAAGVSLDQHLANGRLSIHCARPTLVGLERHLVELCNLVEANDARFVVIDPISSLTLAGDEVA